MAVRTEIVRTFDDNKVQVNVSPRRGFTFCYKVPQENADSFRNEYTKKTKRVKLINTLTMIGAIFASVFALSTINKKVDKKAVKYALETLLAVGIGGGWAVLGSKAEMNALDKVATKYNAEEYIESEYGLPILDKKS